MSDRARQSPFVGLVPYSEEDWEYFFGREGEAELIIANLTASRLTLLYGASGVGKSSVLRAGVAHRLTRQAHHNRDVSGAPELALAIFSAWRDEPLAGLARAVRDGVARATGRDAGPVPAAGELAAACSGWVQQVNGEIFVVLDQFEEYFLYHGGENGEGSFTVEFPRLVNKEGLRVNFLVVIREDAVARLDHFKGRIPNLFENYLRLRHLGLEAAEDAIRKPLERFNRNYPEEAVGIDDALVEEVLRQTRTESVGSVPGEDGAPGAADGTAQIEPPYLQLVMTRLWDEEQSAGSRQLRLQTFTEKLGGSGLIVRTHLDREMQKLEPGERDMAAKAFRYLVTRSGTKIALAVDDLASYTELPPATLAPVLEKLAAGGQRILRPVPVPNRPEVVRYEIFHDVLAQAITDWRRRHDAAKEQEAILQGAEERKRAELRAAEERRERERSRYIKIGASTLSLLLALALGIVGYLLKRATEEKKRATEQAGLARLNQQSAEQALKDLSEQAKAGIESRDANYGGVDSSNVGKPAGKQQVTALDSAAAEERAKAAAELRKAFISGDTPTVEATARRLGLLNEKIRFHARSVPQNYSVAQGSVNEYTLRPDPDSVPGGLGTLSAVTYKMNHPTFKKKLLAGDPAKQFRASYFGWGSLDQVPVLLEYADTSQPPQLAIFHMYDELKAASPATKDQ